MSSLARLAKRCASLQVYLPACSSTAEIRAIRNPICNQGRSLHAQTSQIGKSGLSVLSTAGDCTGAYNSYLWDRVPMVSQHLISKYTSSRSELGSARFYQYLIVSPVWLLETPVATCICLLSLTISQYTRCCHLSVLCAVLYNNLVCSEDVLLSVDSKRRVRGCLC